MLGKVVGGGDFYAQSHLLLIAVSCKQMIFLPINVTGSYNFYYFLKGLGLKFQMIPKV